MICAEKLSITVQERLRDLGETPDGLVDSLQLPIDDATLVRAALDKQLPDLAHPTVRRIERALSFSEFTLFALSSDGRGIPEFGEEVA